jgi:Holliday junction resolvase-like predicted endonuclease
MAEHNELGKWEKKWLSISEETAILSQPTTLLKAEIDILEENTLAVVEVKTRSSLDLDCLSFVKPKKSSFLLKLLMPL